MPSGYNCTLEHCFNGLDLALKLGWYDFKTFNLRDYQFYEKVQNGDLNWTIPRKFISFQGPHNEAGIDDRWTPEDYADLFRDLKVELVIRLNEPVYDRERFVKEGIEHVDLPFVDGGTPTDDIVAKFLEICEATKGAIAVHCKAGLGRTGTLVGLYAMKHYGFSAADFIGWIRIVRPGSILGPQ